VTATIWGYFPPLPKLTQQQQQQQQMSPAKTAALGMVEWRGTDGSLLSRGELAGIPFTSTTGHEGQSAEVVLLVNQRATTLGDEYETQLLIDHLNDTPGPPLQMVAIGRTRSRARQPGCARSRRSCSMASIRRRSTWRNARRCSSTCAAAA
jgi:hypothetical protein